MQSSIKYAIGLATVLLVRLIPGRPPNLEPVLATLMPFAKRSGAVTAFAFGAASIALYDSAVGRIGTWTLVTALAYGAVGLGAHWYLRNRPASVWSWGSYAIIGTLAYDFVTGVLAGPLLWGQSFTAAAIGQVPFTAMHLAGSLVLSLTLTPALYRWVATNPRLEVAALRARVVR